MPVKTTRSPESHQVARLKAALEEDLERMLRWRGPVTEVRRLVSELDRIDQQQGQASSRAGGRGHDHMAS
ncbi:hypothetical protein ACVFYP_16550 [Roseomonas sp. F4]